MPAGLTPESIAPSSLHGDPAAGGIEGLLEETSGLPLDFDLEAAGTDRGLILHRCFEVLGGRSDRLDLLARATGWMPGEEASVRLGQAVAGFDRWIAGRFEPLRVMREVPLLGLDARGSVVSGVLDLLVECAGGYWVLDHKSDVTDDRGARFGVYLPQLRSYAALVRKAFPGKPVIGVGIHWITYGTVSLLPEGGAS
jgi:ATP-dependent exoDNAse (exonuclease V) beta subunit